MGTFRIVEILGNVSEAQAELLLAQLPIDFHIRKDATMDSGRLDESLEVFIYGPIVSIYPPKGRIIAVTMLRKVDAARVMLTECVADMLFPGGGQIRTSFCFDPKALGVHEWHSVLNKEIEVDVYVYPKGEVVGPSNVPDKRDAVVTADQISGVLK